MRSRPLKAVALVAGSASSSGRLTRALEREARDIAPDDPETLVKVVVAKLVLEGHKAVSPSAKRSAPGAA